MSAASAVIPNPAPAPARRRGVPPLPLLTLVNLFNYLDRQVVYGMTPALQAAFRLSGRQVGYLAAANLVVFAVASLVSGPIADRVGPRKVIFAGILVWALATIGSALSQSFEMLLICRAFVGVGEGAYGPSANALLCADAPPEKRGRAMGIYNVGMALGGTLGLCLGALLEPRIGWRNVFWIAGAPSMFLALASAFVAAPPRIALPTKLPAWSYLLKPTYLLALAGGITATFGASALIFWTRELVIEVRHLSIVVGSVYMLFVGLVCGVGGVVVGGMVGDKLSKRARGGHALTIGISMLLAVPIGTIALHTEPEVPFMIVTAGAAFLLSVYNGPSAAVVDELGPPQFAATLQAVFLFGIHVLGNASAPSIVGELKDRTGSLPTALMAAIVAFGVSGVLFVIVAGRQRRSHAAGHPYD
ncbi:MAG: Arabinose efflux permease [Myxococcales bacterium]|nr:Arabinose efflux permease [Myxococcales bacterium]